MFIKDTINNNNLVFIKSKYIKAFPCGRRRSELIDPADDSDKYYIPFDPEARLNTEANNRKHSGLNGYKQSYLNYWKANGDISIVLAGYLFNIASNYFNVADFGTAITKANLLNITGGDIFVNIKLAEIAFFAGTKDVPSASTAILRDQSLSVDPRECLDLLYGTNKTSLDSYYFSGLSFSSEDLEAWDRKYNESRDGWVSLHLLTHNGEKWVIYEPCRLPNIDHGTEKNSVEILGSLTLSDAKDENGNVITKGDLTIAGTINANDISLNYGSDSNGNEIKGYATILNVSDNNQLQFWTRPQK